MLLEKLTEIFNTREIAIAIWITMILIWVLTKLEIIQIIKDVAKIFFGYKILVPYLLGVAYTLLGIFLLFKMNLWSFDQTKDTIFWCIFTIIGILVNLNKVRKNKNYFKDAVKENFKLSILVEFIFNIRTFSLPVELILIPVVTFLLMMQAVAESNIKYSQVQKFISGILFLSGMFVFCHIIYQIITHIREIAPLNTIRDFILPLFLAIWILPWIYVMTLFMSYEEFFITMKMRIKDKKLLNYAKVCALVYFKTDTEGFTRWKNRLFIGSVTSKSDIIKSIKEIKRLQALEKNPPKIDFDIGWSPYLAKNFLISLGLGTSYYNNVIENEWMASSPPLKLDDEWAGNTLTYAIDGNETAATKLQLYLNIFNQEGQHAALAKFLECAEVLHEVSLHQLLPKAVRKAILKKSNLKISGEVELEIRQTKFKNEGQYRLLFSISRKNKT